MMILMTIIRVLCIATFSLISAFVLLLGKKGTKIKFDYAWTALFIVLVFILS